MNQILIVDDDPTIRLVLSRTLGKQGYEVIAAKNGEEGLFQAQQLHPDLIICDWMMPGIDGLEVCRQVKANPDLSTTFFILLTSRGAIEDRVRGLDTGADDFLSKPIEMNELKARVRAGLRLHQLSEDLQTQKEILEAELAEAAGYVQSLLPGPLKGAVTIDARFIPSQQLGGDCFDYYWLDPDYLVIYLLDVSGHGLGAALLSISLLNVLRSQALPGVNFYQPNNVLAALNDTFQMSDQNEKYFTIWYGVYNRVRHQLVYASAGHPPAILISRTSPETLQVQRLKTPSLPIGMFPDIKFSNERCNITALSALYIFSDGIYEFNQVDGTPWSLDEFVDLVAQNQETATLDHILYQIQGLNARSTFDDDLSLLKINFS